MNLKLFLAIVVLVFGASSVAAQQISGQVRAADSGQPIFNAIIHCEGSGTSQIIQTDYNGKFVCNVGGPGNYNIRADLPGYIEEQRSVNMPDVSATEYMLFRLKPDPALKPRNVTALIDPNVPPDARAEFEKGEAALAVAKKEKIQEGITHLEKAVVLYPKFTQAQLRIGTAYMDLGQWDKAEQALLKTVQLDPKAANAFFALGEINLRQKRFEDAEKNLLQGLKIEDTSAPGHLTLGRAYWEMGSKIKDTEQARPFLDKSYEQAKRAIELNPNFADAHLLRGNLLFRVRRAADAQHEYEEYLRLDPKGAFADQTRALVERIKKALAEVKP